MNPSDLKDRIMRKVEDCIDAIDLDKTDAEIVDLVDALTTEMKTVLMKDDGTIN